MPATRGRRQGWRRLVPAGAAVESGGFGRLRVARKTGSYGKRWSFICDARRRVSGRGPFHIVARRLRQQRARVLPAVAVHVEHGNAMGFQHRGELALAGEELFVHVLHPRALVLAAAGVA